MLSSAAKAFGAVFLVLGVLGFVPGFTPDGHLLGIFDVDTFHNIIHLSSGVVALFAGFKSEAASRLYFQAFGIVYGLVAILGFVYMDREILGLVANNMADNLLHVAIAGSALTLGFGSFGREKDASYE